MHKQTYKRIQSTLILTLLVISVLPLISLNLAPTGAPTLNPTSGPVGTEVTVSGSDAEVFGKVEIFWDSTAPASKLDETYATGTGAYSIDITIPEDVAGTHYIIAKCALGTKASAFTIEPDIEVDPESGLPGNNISVTGTGFAGESNISIIFENFTGTIFEEDVTPAVFDSTASGTFTSWFIVPAVDYGTYSVTVRDNYGGFGGGNETSESFEVIATVTLSPEEGPVGTVVDLSGIGFNKSSTVNIWFDVDGDHTPDIIVKADVATDENGEFSTDFIVPTVGSTGDYDVTVEDSKYGLITTIYAVTGLSAITLTPVAGKPATTVTVEGENFTSVADTDIKVRFGTILVGTFQTDETGSFTGTFGVPSLPTATYVVNASDAANFIFASKDFTVAITLATIDPDEGATGTKVTITGYGFTGSTANVTMDSTVVIDSVTTAALALGASFVVPTLAVGEYTVTVMDNTGLTATEAFTVTETTDLLIDPVQGPKTVEISIEASYYTAEAGKALTFAIMNSTWSDTLTVSPVSPWTALETDAEGSFEGTFIVPDIDLGDYTINATDENDLIAESSFSIVLPTVIMNSISDKYVAGGTVSFNVKSTFRYTFTITITDPTDIEYVIDLANTDEYWQTIEDWEYARPTKTALELITDAPIGIWSWEATLGEVEKSGTFEVAVIPTGAEIEERLTALEEQLADLTSKLEDLSDFVETDVTQDIEDVSTVVSGIQSAANAAQSAAEAAKTAAENASNTASNISMSVYGAMALSGIAAIAAIAAIFTLRSKVAG
jgi:hypothetical protein